MSHFPAGRTHETIHSELINESTVGVLERVLAGTISRGNVAPSLRSSLQGLLDHLCSCTFGVHEGIATYIGLDVASHEAVEAVPYILDHLPVDYLNALAPILSVFPKPDGSSSVWSHCSYFLLLGCGRFVLELPTLGNLHNRKPRNWIELSRHLFSPSPDDQFLELFRLLSDGNLVGELIDTIRRASQSMLNLSSAHWYQEMSLRAAEQYDSQFIHFQNEVAQQLGQRLARLCPNLGCYIAPDERLSRLSELFSYCNDLSMALDGKPVFPPISFRQQTSATRPIVEVAPLIGESAQRGSPYYDVTVDQAIRNIARTVFNGHLNAELMTLRIQVRAIFNPSDQEVVASIRLTVPPKHWFVTFDTYVDESPSGELPPIDAALQLKQACGGRYAAILESSEFRRVIEATTHDIAIWHLRDAQYNLANDEGLDPESWTGRKFLEFESESTDVYVSAITEATKTGRVIALPLTVFQGRMTALVCQPSGSPLYYWKTLVPVDALITLKRLTLLDKVDVIHEHADIDRFKIDASLVYKCISWHYSDWSGVHPDGET